MSVTATIKTRARWTTTFVIVLTVCPLSLGGCRQLSDPLEQSQLSNAEAPGRLAVVAGGNFGNSADLSATPISLAVLRSFGLEEKLVHFSHSCDISNTYQYREMEHQLSCDGTASRWGHFKHLDFYNCRQEQTTAVHHLRDQVNASSATDRLYIVAAGDPDIISLALTDAESDKRQHVSVITHQPDLAGKDDDLSGIVALGAQELRIPNQNNDLSMPLSTWHWAREHSDPRIRWLWDRGVVAEQDPNYDLIRGKFDCSDAGMVYYWATGADRGGVQRVTVSTLRDLLTTHVDASVSFATPSNGEVLRPGSDLYVNVDSTGLLASMALSLNGTFLDRQASGVPWEWGAAGQDDPLLRNLDAGSYTLRAVGVTPFGGSIEDSISIAVGEASSVTPPSGWTQLEFRHSGKCVDNMGQNGIGTEYWQLSCDDVADPTAPNRNFRFESMGSGYYRIRNQSSNLCMDTTGVYGRNAPIKKSTCNSDAQLQWRLVDKGGDWFEIRSRVGDYTVNQSSASLEDRGVIQQHESVDAASQQLKFSPAGTVSSVTPPLGWTQLKFRHSGKCLDNMGQNGIGTEYWQWRCDEPTSIHPNRYFRFESMDGGYYRIRNQSSNLCMDTTGVSGRNAPIKKFTCNQDARLQWRLVDKGGGWFEIRSRMGDYTVNQSSASLVDGGIVEQHESVNAASQQLTF